MSDLDLISLKAVLARVPISKSEVYRRIRSGNFPSRVRLGPNRIAFVETEIEGWLRAFVDRRSGGVETSNGH